MSPGETSESSKIALTAMGLLEAWSDVALKRWNEPCVRAGMAQCCAAIFTAMTACGLRDEVEQEMAAVLGALLGDESVVEAWRALPLPECAAHGVAHPSLKGEEQ